MGSSLDGPPRRGRSRGAVLALLAFAQCIIAVDYNIVFVALPDIGRGLHFAPHDLQWVVSAYAVFFGGFLLLGGRATDLFGRHRIFRLGLALYALGSLAGGLAGDPRVLIAARAVQGLGGALLAPATLSLVTTKFAEGAERNRALAVWGGAGGSGMVLGSLLGGVLTQAFGWSSVFYVNVLLAGAALLVSFPLLGRDERGPAGRDFDLLGAVTATGGSLSLVFALVEGPAVGWGSPSAVGPAVLAVLLLALFLLTEARSRRPLLPLRLLRNRDLAIGTVVTFLFMASFGALAYFFTEYFQTVKDYSALRTGFAFLVPCVSVLIGTVLGGRSVTRLGVRNTLLVSLAAGLAGTLAFAVQLGADTGYGVLVPSLAVLSIGQGMVFTTMFAAASTGVAPEEQGIASGVATTGQQVGGAVGLAVLVAVAARSGASGAGQAAAAHGIRVAVFGAAIGVALIVVAALGFKRPAVVPSAPRPAPGQDAESALAAEQV